MASRKKKQSGIVRCFEVTEPTLHPKGHTIYKVFQRVIKVDCPEEEVQELVVWRRYNDFKKLYKAMLKLHQALHRKDEFPPFEEGKVFGRFDDEVIKRRQLSGQDLLNFVGQRNYLIASRAFQQFFEGAEIHEFDGPAALIPPILPNKLQSEDPEDYEDRPQPDGEESTTGQLKAAMDGLVEGVQGALTKVPSYNQLLGGVWRYRQIADEISLGGDDDDDDTDFTDDSAMSTPLPDNDMSFFDPLNPTSEPSEDLKAQLEYSSEFLLSQEGGDDSEAVTTVTEEDEELRQLEQEFEASGIEDELTVDEPDVAPVKTGSVIERGKGDLVFSPTKKPSQFSRLLHSLTSTPSASPVHSAKASPARSPLRQPHLVNIDVKDKADYIFLAANQISLAQQCEANANYHMAFSYYKNAVGIMLTGVQFDDNKTRREVVRKKTAKYLLKAEELYHLYLDSREKAQHGHRWDTGKPSPTKELDPNVAFIQGSISELKSYKVLGVIDKVLLVIDTLSDQTYVIKVLHKSCTASLTRRNIVPVRQQFSVQLHKFYETDNAVYLLLHHATGGRLWTYVSGYLQQPHSDADLEHVLNDPHERQLRAGAAAAATVVSSNGHRQGDDGSVKAKGAVNDDRTNVPEESGINIQGEDQVHFYTSKEDEVTDSTADLDPKSDAPQPQRKLPLRSVSMDSGDHSSATHFEDLLKRTQNKQCLENFSINSIDSDSGPGSRLESTTSDFIESIPERSENSSPECSPTKKHSDAGDVFSTNLLPSTINSAIDILTEADKELEDDILAQNKPVKTPSADSSSEEPSIYDAYKDEQDSGDSQTVKPATKPTLPSAPLPKETLGVRSPVMSPSKSLESAGGVVFRLPSQERSVDSERKSRPRHLSGVFGSLNTTEDKIKATAWLPEICVKHWAAEILIAIAGLHKLGIICRDLQPRNVLLGDRGHILLTFFSQWNAVDDVIDPSAFDLLYSAPEVGGVNQVTPACDWWSFGALLYELLTGKTLAASHPSGVTSHTQILIPDHLSQEAQGLLVGLLKYHPEERLGSGSGGLDDIRGHPFFSEVDWIGLQGDG